jgi:hypothetical protein
MALNSSLFFNQRKSQFRDKGAKVIYGLSRYNKLLGILWVQKSLSSLFQSHLYSGF